MSSNSKVDTKDIAQVLRSNEDPKCPARIVNKELQRGTGQSTKGEAKGDSPHYRTLGNMYFQGEGRSRNYKRAFMAYRKALNYGELDAESRSNLAWMYAKGHGVERDYEGAHVWYLVAAKQGYAIAQFNLGLLYYLGAGALPDNNKAILWFEKAAKQGLLHAQIKLGHIFSEESPQNHGKAIFWYTQAAEQGNQYGQAYLGYMYLQDGAHQNYKKARYWLQQSSSQGNHFSQYWLTRSSLLIPNGPIARVARKITALARIVAGS